MALPDAVDRPNPGFFSTHALDRAFKANLARLTAGITPAGLASAYFEWLGHLMLSPGKQLELEEKFFRKLTRFGLYTSRQHGAAITNNAVAILPGDLVVAPVRRQLD